MLTERFYSACLVIGLGMVLARPAVSQPYRFTKVLDGSTQRPDGAGTFFIGVANTTPAFDGKWVVFRDPGPQNDDGSHAAIWSFNTLDGTFHKLVDFNTSVPGGAAKFNDIQLLDTAPTVRNGIVVFVARDTTTGPNRQGLYSVGAAGGGPITKIADYNTADPSGGTFTVFDSYAKQVGAFSFDGTTVAFSANGSGVTLGVYSAKPDGSSLGLVADNLHPYTAQNNKVAAFNDPAISGSNVVMIGTDGLDPSTGYNGVYLGMAGGNGSLTELLNSKQQLPGNPNSGFHTRFDAPVLASDGTLVALRADDSNSAGFFGLYSTDLTSHTINKIADVNSALPGLGKLNAIGNGGIAVSQGSVLFMAADNSGSSGLYLWKNGMATRIIGTGDRLDGQTVQGLADPGPAALYGSGFAFNVDFGRGRALYVATPSSNAMTLASVANSASYGTSSIAPGEIVTLFGAGLGPPALTGFQLDANNRIATLLSGVRILFNGYPAPLAYVSDKQSAAIVPFGMATFPNAEILVEYNGNVSNTITVPVTNTMPGLFSANSSGSGPGAIQNADGSYNTATNPAAPGSIIVLYLSGLGQLNPAQTDGSIVSGSTLPALQYPVSVTVGGQAAQIVYQGPAPLAVAGLYQINCVIPPGTPSGSAAVLVAADGKQSQPNLTVAVR